MQRSRHHRPPRQRRWRPLRKPLTAAVVAALAVAAVAVGSNTAQAAVPFPFEVQRLDGSGNNVANPAWGRSGVNYTRVAPARYADGLGQPVSGPNSRMISNRVFNDANQNLFSERRVTQWGFVWGQFLDHTFGLRNEAGTTANIPFNSADPMESFTNTLGYIPFVRSGIAPGTGVTSPREQPNTVSSYIDAWAVYGGTNQRLEWLRDGPVDGNLSNNGATLLLQNGLLPRRDARGNASTAPLMAVDGRLLSQPNRAMVAGDVRANENIALTATHTLFAREHNRIASLLPSSLTNEDRFQIARRIVIAEQQYITYNEFLPALGVNIPRYTGYKSNVNSTLSNEFAVVGYRAHSMIHGELEMEAELSRYSQSTLDALAAQGVEIAIDGGEVELAVPLNVAFFNPDIISQLQLGPLLQGIGLESEYKNDEQIDNQLRSVLFQVPTSANPECLDGPGLPDCFSGVVDLGAIDVERGRDHGMLSYNQLRQAYGLPARSSFTAITGESTESFPSGTGSNSPNSLDFLSLRDIDGVNIDLADEAAAEGTGTSGTRRSTVAARLRAIYGSVGNVDAFVGMVAEPHVPGTDMGELQLAIWTREFARLRDGDRFFYGNDPGLSSIMSTYGIDFRRTLGQVISANTDIPAAELNPNVFLVAEADLPAPACTVIWTKDTEWPSGFQVSMTIRNNLPTPINGWQLRWRWGNGQTVSQLWNGGITQSTSGSTNGNVTVSNASWNPSIGANGGTVGGVGFNGIWDNATNGEPPNFTLNNRRCETI